MADDRVVWLNGRLIPWGQATVPLLSHGFSRASAIFEAFGVHGMPDSPLTFRMDEHLKRLKNSADLLGMELAYSEKEIGEAVSRTVRANKIGRGVVKIMAYWGEEMVFQMVPDSKLDLAVFAIPTNDTGFNIDDATPISACLSKWRKFHPETCQVAAKACANYLSSYLVRKEAKERGYDLGFLLDLEGFVAEGASESIFLVRDGILKTPPLGRILPSITRMSIIEMAPFIGIPVEETALRKEDLFTADEIFTSHTGAKILPVGRFEDRDLNAPGPVTGKLIRLMDDILQFRNDKFSHYFQSLG